MIPYEIALVLLDYWTKRATEETATRAVEIAEEYGRLPATARDYARGASDVALAIRREFHITEEK